MKRTAFSSDFTCADEAFLPEYVRITMKIIDLPCKYMQSLPLSTSLSLLSLAFTGSRGSRCQLLDNGTAVSRSAKELHAPRGGIKPISSCQSRWHIMDSSINMWMNGKEGWERWWDRQKWMQAGKWGRTWDGWRQDEGINWWREEGRCKMDNGDCLDWEIKGRQVSGNALIAFFQLVLMHDSKTIKKRKEKLNEDPFKVTAIKEWNW